MIFFGLSEGGRTVGSMVRHGIGSEKRDAARTRRADSYDVREHTKQDAEKAEAQTDPDRHHDAF